MEKDPRDRLGAGGKHSKNTMKELKEHSFFKGMKFKRLYKKNPKVPRKLIDKVNKDFSKKDEFDIENLTENDDEQVVENKIQIKVFKTFTATDKKSFLNGNSRGSNTQDYSKMSSTRL
jgi:hypothetical protein